MIYLVAVINWATVLFNGLWILGAAIILASLSYQYGRSDESTPPTTFKQRLNELAFLQAFWIGIFFINIGLAGTSDSAWETVLWAVFALFALFTLVQSYFHKKEQ